MTADRSALILLHGSGRSGGSAWRNVVPLLTDHHQVYTPTALGHRGGPPVKLRPVVIRDVVDAAERQLDELELDRPHIAGNSLGAYIAVELARRGRAATVCALSLPGLWSAGDGLQARLFKLVQRNLFMGRLLRPAFPLMAKSAPLRKFGMRDVNVHGDRLTPTHFVQIIDEALASADIVVDLSEKDWGIEPMDPLPCPITVVWGEKDTLLPMPEYSDQLLQLLPRAAFTVLPGVGHEPMPDDPHLVAHTILNTTGVVTN